MDPVLDEMTNILVSRFAPERIVLFGSRAREDHFEDSDYDLIVVLDAPVGPEDQRLSIRAALSAASTNVDVIVCTPAEFEERRSDVGTFVHAGEVEGRVLYDRTPSRWSKRVSEVPRVRSKSLKHWLQRAENDFAAMRDIAAGSASPDTICFHAHQSAEKFLKSALIVNHVRPPRTHELPVLLRACTPTLRANGNVEDACANLESVWPKSRYPDDGMPTRAEAEHAIAAATVIRDAARQAIIPDSQGPQIS